jgi:transposase
MDRRNRYFYRTHISERKFKEILRYFSIDLGATKIAELTGISRNSINKILSALRKRLAEICEEESPFEGEIEVDESYFWSEKSTREKGPWSRR